MIVLLYKLADLSAYLFMYLFIYLFIFLVAQQTTVAVTEGTVPGLPQWGNSDSSR